jgi:hypothetical protein
MMNAPKRRNNEQQQAFTRQANILRKNLYEWDRMLRTPRGEDWPNMVGRLNAAANQTNNLDRSIDDVLEHFVYLPKQSPANAADIPFFLSTRLADATVGPGAENIVQEETNFFGNNDPVQVMTRYENQAAELASEYEENMIRF